jgi:hypothetical protein
MTQISGHSYVTCYHPENDDEWCEVKVNWIHSYDRGDYYDPPYEDTDIENVRLITYNDKPVAKDTPVPDWVTNDELMEGIDIFKDGYDGDDN